MKRLAATLALCVLVLTSGTANAGPGFDDNIQQEIGDGQIGHGYEDRPVEGPNGRPRLVSAGPVGTWVSSVIGACWLDGTYVLFLYWLGPPGAFPDLSDQRDAFAADGDMLGWVLITPDGRAVVLTIQNTCDPNDPGPQPPPDPIRIWEQTPLPDPEVLTSPLVRGLVGVPNHFWYEGPDRISLDPIVINGWTVETEAQLDHVDWELGNGTTVTATADELPGSPDAPAATATYGDDGDFTITARVTWTGVSTISGFGQSFTTTIGSASTSTSRPYEVLERQAAVDYGSPDDA